LKITRQQRRIASEARDAAIGVLKYDEVKLPAASRNLFGNLTDGSEGKSVPAADCRAAKSLLRSNIESRLFMLILRL
jgi:hypothetical protein